MPDFFHLFSANILQNFLGLFLHFYLGGDKKNLKNGKRRGQRKQKRKGVYDKNGGITHDTAVFALALKIY